MRWQDRMKAAEIAAELSVAEHVAAGILAFQGGGGCQILAVPPHYQYTRRR
jgi:hypothetical protein